MTTQQAWYIGQRAESLAVMYLTRRDDLIVSKQPLDSGLDFLVTIKKFGSYSGRIFGIDVKATDSISKSVQDDDIVTIQLNLDSIDFLAELPFPVCLFFFFLNKNQGYYKWVLEPVIEGQDNRMLHFHQSHEFKKLTDEEIDNMISAVNSWYDNRK